MNIVAISGKRRSGKSTLGNILNEDYGYHPLSLAMPLKRMAQEQFGLVYEQTDGIFKESPTQFKKPSRDYVLEGEFYTPRDILIHLGQAYRKIDTDFWAKKLFNQMAAHPQAQLKTYVVTDMRFLNELEWMKRHNAVLIRLERDEAFTGKNIEDPSETELDSYQGWDLKVPKNENTSLSDLYKTAERINDLILTRA
jgi:hypothetical protein